MATTKAKATVETISDRTWNSEQSWYRELIVEVGSRKLRFFVRKNAYVFQSYARACVWSGDEWKQVHRIAGEQLLTEARYTDRGVTPDAFLADIAELRRVASAVLGVSL